jgi:NTP pyrophosphatase (non-canonical NTP hydrolase)
MTFDDYSAMVRVTRDYPDLGKNLIYPALGLSGEAGEVAEKVKKLWRNHGQRSGDQISAEDRASLVKELGDVLWYVAAMSEELDVKLEHVAEQNSRKLLDRKERGVIKSAGDSR